MPEPQVRWITSAPVHPLCDVPWMGTSVVLSDGNVNFCCFSSAVVGNVNEESFELIWNGETMQRIRGQLARQRFPAECQSTSCPLYRGDDATFLHKRMNGELQSWVREGRELLREATLEIDTEQLKVGQAPEFTMRMGSRQGLPFDLFIGLQFPDSTFRFLPDYTEYAVPFCRVDPPYPMEFSAKLLPKHFMQVGRYEICAAFFERESNPAHITNCYWAATKRMHVQYELMKETRAAVS